MQIKCTNCGRALKVPDALKGKKVKCPACQREILIPASSAQLDALQIEPAVETPMRSAGPKRSAPAPASGKHASSARRSGRKELQDFQQNRAHGKPQVETTGPAVSGTCPGCGAQMPPATVVCPSCGYDMLGGAGYTKGESSLNRLKGFIAPVIAILLVVVGGNFLIGKVRKTAGDIQQGNQPSAQQAQTPTQQQPVQQVQPVNKGPVYTAEGFKGGEIKDEVKLTDVSSAYSIGEDIKIPANAKLVIGPGVQISGSGEIKGDGSLICEGTASAPVILDVSINISSSAPDGPQIKCAGVRFNAPISIAGPGAVNLLQSEFAEGLTLNLKDKSSKVEAVVNGCVLNPGKGGASISFEVPSSTGKMTLAVNGCDIIGKASGSIGSFSAVDFSQNYWSDGLGDGTAGIRGDGKKVFDNASSKPLMEGALAATAVGAGTGFDLSSENMIIKVPAGWQKGGSTSARKIVPGGSVTLLTVFQYGRAQNLDNVFTAQKSRYMTVDKNAAVVSLQPADFIEPQQGSRQYTIDLAWEGAPYKVFFYLLELKKGQGGVIFSMPVDSWEKTLPEIREMLSKSTFEL